MVLPQPFLFDVLWQEFDFDEVILWLLSESLQVLSLIILNPDRIGPLQSIYYFIQAFSIHLGYVQLVWAILSN